MSEAKTKSIGTKVAPALYDSLQQIAAVQRRTVADVVREMIEESLKRWADNVGSYDPADVMAKLLELEAKVDRGAEAACEGRYFGRLSAMYGMDVAHYVAQKVEPGVAPAPPDADEKKRLISMYERKSREFTDLYLKRKGEEEPS